MLGARRSNASASRPNLAVRAYNSCRRGRPQGGAAQLHPPCIDNHSRCVRVGILRAKTVLLELYCGLLGPVLGGLGLAAGC